MPISPHCTTSWRTAADRFAVHRRPGSAPAGAAFRLMSTPSARLSPAARSAQLSRRAIEYAAALGLEDPAALAERLYRYNSLPASPAWRRRVPDERAAAALLALDRRPRGSRGRRDAEADAHRSAIWQVWDADAPASLEAVYKLYVSPKPLETAIACRALLDELGRPGGPFSVKVALDPPSLLRPDRLVGYFATRAACLATARRLAPRLAGLAPQGVPFTAAIGGSAILSWGADPPAAVAESLPRGERSWRGWVTARVARAVIGGSGGSGGNGGNGGNGGKGGTDLRGVIARLRREGVDPVRWRPPW